MKTEENIKVEEFLNDNASLHIYHPENDRYSITYDNLVELLHRFASRPSPTYVSDEEIKDRFIINEFSSKQDKLRVERQREAARWMRSLIFKEGKPKEDDK